MVKTATMANVFTSNPVKTPTLQQVSFDPWLTAGQSPIGLNGADVQVMDFKEVDKLISAMNMSNEMKIGAGHGPLRVLLVRPRTNFVPELYKSIENL